MKNLLVAIIPLSFLFSCGTHDDSEVMRLATEFAGNTIDSALVFTDGDGVVTMGDTRARYVINPAQIFRGRLHEHSGNSIWVTIDSLHDPYLVPLYHLVLSEKKGELGIQNSIRSDMRVLAITRGKITAEIPTHLPESPLYYCSECRDTVQFLFSGGKLVRVD